LIEAGITWREERYVVSSVVEDTLDLLTAVTSKQERDITELELVV
jgi:hypothetical protein